MLTADELVEQISATIGKARVIELTKTIREQHFPLRDLIDITFHPDKNIAFRASWVLENVLLDDMEAYIADINYLMERFVTVNYPSSQRHYGNIMMRITSSKAPQAIKEHIKHIDFNPVIEHLFEWMIDPEIKIAVKCCAAEALFNMRQQYDWINEELKEQLQYLMRDGTAAIQARGKKLLKGLNKRISNNER
jgi:hypothetical protein